MTDVLIRKCTLRVVRHGGWSWGANRRAILENATAALPRLIAERLGELLADVHGEIAQPIRLRFALRAGQLASGAGLAGVVASGIRADLLPVPVAMDAAAAKASAARESKALATDAPSIHARDTVAYAGGLAGARDVLLRWRNQGVLWQRLEALSRRALEAWLAAFVNRLQEASRRPSIVEAIERDGIALARSIPMSAGDNAGVQRARLAIAAELVARHGDEASRDAVVRALDRAIPLSSPEAAAVQEEAAHRDELAPGVNALRDEAPTLAKTDVVAPASSHRSPATGERTELCSVLPYLVLGVLHRLGWLDIASASLRALDVPDAGSAFATALAYKLLPVAQRGWHRTSGELRTAAAFAGVRTPPSPYELARWSRHAADVLAPLDDFIAAELARCHDCGLPLLVMRVESRHELPWLLFDADGGFPVAWQRDEAAVRRLVRRFGPCVVLVSAEAATPALMSGLVADHRCIVTSATPSRHDDWLRVKGTACWAAGAQALSRRLLRATTLFPELMAQALAVTRELVHLRPAAPPREGAQLEHSAALAAAVGLGSIAATLWRERETVNPLLALERFGNLDGVARRDGPMVKIVPAFGRRYLDLMYHGLLADIPAPPWIDARRIVFAGP